MAIAFILVLCLCQSHIYGQINIAIGKMAKESSANNFFTGFLAIDGLYSQPYCFMSQTSRYQWLQINLIWSYRIDRIYLFGKLSTNVYTTKLTDSNLNLIAPCKNITNQLNKVNVSFTCPNGSEYSSRYVTIEQSPSSNDTMNVCEVVVEGQYAEPLPQRTNVLLKKNATMNSPFPAPNVLTGQSVLFTADLAVDGIRDTIMGHAHCAGTIEGGFVKNWIQVDMGADYYIDYIALTSRYTSVPFSKRMSNFIIGLTPYSASVITPIRGQYPLCAIYPGDVPVASRVTLQCNANLPAYRYFIAHQAVGALDGYFSACELEAYEPQKRFPSKQVMWTSKQNFRVLNSTFLTIPATRPLQCIKQCIKLGQFECDSFNFNIQLNICELNKHRNGFQVGTWVSNQNWSFWTGYYSYIGNL